VRGKRQALKAWEWEGEPIVRVKGGNVAWVGKSVGGGKIQLAPRCLLRILYPIEGNVVWHLGQDLTDLMKKHNRTNAKSGKCMQDAIGLSVLV